MKDFPSDVVVKEAGEHELRLAEMEGVGVLSRLVFGFRGWPGVLKEGGR